MALGDSTLKQVRSMLGWIENDLKYGDIESQGVYSCWNTFDYVAKHLGEWADDTTIGAETKANMQKLSSILKELIEETRKLHNRLENFCSEQERSNLKG